MYVFLRDIDCFDASHSQSTARHVEFAQIGVFNINHSITCKTVAVRYLYTLGAHNIYSVFIVSKYTNSTTLYPLNLSHNSSFGCALHPKLYAFKHAHVFSVRLNISKAGWLHSDTIPDRSEDFVPMSSL